MKFYHKIISAFLILPAIVSVGETAMVRYVDKNGKFHYVNTGYSKIPPEYQDQVQGQTPDNAQTNSSTVPTIQIDTPQLPEGIVTEKTIGLFTRLNSIIFTLKAKNLLPAGSDVDRGLVSYLDQNRQVHFVRPEELGTVPDEFLPQIRAQLDILENKINPANGRAAALSRSLVQFYTRANCAECDEMETLLKSEKIKYTSYDVETSPEGKKRFQEMTNKKMPYTRIAEGRYRIRGADINAVKAALKALEEPWSAGVPAEQ